MTLYRNKLNSLYYRVIQGRVSYSDDKIIWWPSIFTGENLLVKPEIFEEVEESSATLENK